MADLDFTFRSFRGAEIASQFEPLGRLRITVFRDYPYLYEGDLAYEMRYLHTYSASPEALLHAVFYRGSMVGATTCLPLKDEQEEVVRPFLDAGMAVEEIFYFGESILLSEYRGLGIGKRFFDEREAHAASSGAYRHTCFCAVQRREDHPLRPPGYVPLDAFWTARGYRKVPGLVSHFDWLDVGETQSTSKSMVFWMRAL